MSTTAALRLAAGDLRHNTRVLVPLSFLAVLGLVAAVLPLGPARVLLPLAVGPVVAVLLHLALLVVDGGRPTWDDARAGLRRTWRRGLLLGAATLAFLVVGIQAVVVYAERLPALAFLAFDALALLLVGVLVLWPLAVRHAEQPPGAAVRAAGLVLAQAPWAAVRLALALLVVNVVGLALVVPFLLLGAAFTALAVAHFVTAPPPPAREQDQYPHGDRGRRALRGWGPPPRGGRDQHRR